MNKIKVLPPHMADLIAAGEVVERPASVVKELLENAIDAGATACTVETQNGGMTYIRVTDNGSGMSREDAQTAFLRHATSKIRSESDLESIGTLGFRGEALAAISAVSRVDMLTCLTGGQEGTSLSLEGGQILDCQSAGCPHGTTIIVRDLFFNTPARHKFMKKDAAESSAVRVAVQNAALSHPEVSIKYIRDGKEELHTAGDGELKNCIYSTLGREFALSLIPVSRCDEFAEVTGFVVKPTACRGNRAMEHFFINGRYIKSASLAASLEAAYRNRAMVGKFPGCVLDIRVKKSAVDVNVHPAKTEVRLFNQRQVCDAVYGAAMNALDGDGPVKTVQEHNTAQAQPREDFFKTMTAREYRESANTSLKTPTQAYNAPAAPAKSVKTGGFTVKTFEPPVVKTESKVPVQHQPAVKKEESAPKKPEEKAAPVQQVMAEITPVQTEIPDTPPAKTVRVVGEVMKTYIVAEMGDTVLFIDKHAAHERILFDKLSAQVGSVMSQTLLLPETFTPQPEELSAILENMDLVEAFGFKVEEHFGGALVVRACPADIDAKEAVPALEEIGAELSRRGTADPDYARNKVLSTVACKAAIKAGRLSHISELEALAEKVTSGQVKYCPHGRPVAVEMTKSKLDKMFGRT